LRWFKPQAVTHDDRYTGQQTRKDENSDQQPRVVGKRILAISPVSLAKEERGAEASLDVRYLSYLVEENARVSDLVTNHRVNFSIHWKPRKLFGRVVTGGRYEVPVGTPSSLHISMKIVPSNDCLRQLLQDRVKGFLSKERMPLVGPPGRLSMVAEAVAGFDEDWVVGVMKRMLTTCGGELADSGFAGALGTLCPPTPQRPKRGIMRHSISGAEFLSNLREMTSRPRQIENEVPGEMGAVGMENKNPNVMVKLAAVDPEKTSKLVIFDQREVDISKLVSRAIYVTALNNADPEVLDVELTVVVQRNDGRAEQRQLKRSVLPSFSRTLVDQSPKQGQDPKEFARNTKFVSVVGPLVTLEIAGDENRIDVTGSYHSKEGQMSWVAESWEVTTLDTSRSRFTLRRFCVQCAKFRSSYAKWCENCGGPLDSRGARKTFWIDAFQAGLASDTSGLDPSFLRIQEEEPLDQDEGTRVY